MPPKVMKNNDLIRKNSIKVREDNEVEHIWKQGFPLGTNYDQAIADATANAKALAGIKASLISSEIIQTPEHEANNEFLVSLVFGKVRPDKDKS